MEELAAEYEAALRSAGVLIPAQAEHSLDGAGPISGAMEAITEVAEEEDEEDEEEGEDEKEGGAGAAGGKGSANRGSRGRGRDDSASRVRRRSVERGGGGRSPARSRSVEAAFRRLRSVSPAGSDSEKAALAEAVAALEAQLADLQAREGEVWLLFCIFRSFYLNFFYQRQSGTHKHTLHRPPSPMSAFFSTG